MVGRLGGLGGLGERGGKGLFLVLQYYIDVDEVLEGNCDNVELALMGRCKFTDELWDEGGKWEGGGVRRRGSRKANLVQKEVQVNIKTDRIRKFEDRDRLEGWDLGPVENSGCIERARQKNLGNNVGEIDQGVAGLRFSSTMEFPQDQPSLDKSEAQPKENIPLEDQIGYPVNKNQFTKPAPKGINAKSTEIADASSEADQFNLNHYANQAQAFRFGFRDENFYRRQSPPNGSQLANLDNNLKLLS